jgi:hypothetical protein
MSENSPNLVTLVPVQPTAGTCLLLYSWHKTVGNICLYQLHIPIHMYLKGWARKRGQQQIKVRSPALTFLIEFLKFLQSFNPTENRELSGKRNQDRGFESYQVKKCLSFVYGKKLSSHKKF